MRKPSGAAADWLQKAARQGNKEAKDFLKSCAKVKGQLQQCKLP